jgi:hypothetical protein
MPPKTLLLGITVLSIVIIVAGVGWTLVNNTQPFSPTTASGSGQTSTIGNTNETQPAYPDTTTNDTTSGTSATSPDNAAGTTSNNTTLVPTLSPQEQIRDQSMTFLKNSKAETAALMTNLLWTGGRDNAAPEGIERYLYYSVDNTWSVTVESSTNSTSAYTITGLYNSPTMTVSFTETYTNGTFKLTSYPPPQRYPATPGP